MELNLLQESFQPAATRQELSLSKSLELIDQISREIEHALRSIEPDNDSITVLTEVKAKLQALALHSHLERQYQEVDMLLSQHEENLEKMLFPDISKALRIVKFDHHTINQIIISHLYREGLFHVADSLINEAREPEPTSLKLQFQKIHSVVNVVKAENIDPALNWIAANQGMLKESYPDLELKLHKTLFVDILQNEGRDFAHTYAKNFLVALAPHQEMKKLMCSLLWARRLENSPYPDFLKPNRWDSLADELFHAFCNLTGQPHTDPLKVSVAAGGEALPTLLKWMDLVIGNEESVEVELGQEFQFHSFFVCPIIYRQSSQANPAMMLPCGHCLCNNTIDILANDNNEDETFKCPFCLMRPSVADCLQLYYCLSALWCCAAIALL
ncbi:putative E3 ubiquitin ligase [Handroanthus impetiginosus]|uniref:Putative E3 ubiquitin ligase n=1 Tax=Handroanthus impetiginosus TaxID=429701 RepID=A0A2G9HH59_9LAMI|nr:putative E3 ubiquitin ligase [Handroanthus impetiginosus]